MFELDDRGRGIIPLELEDIADARAAPAIDRLVRIASHREIWVVDRKTSHNAILHRVCVLVFVDKDPPVPRVEHSSQVRVVDQHASDVHEQVIEVNRVCLQHHLLVGRPDPLGDLVDRTTPSGLERLWRRQFVLRPADNPRHTVDRGVRQRQPEFLGSTLQQ